jgi:predicted RNase H-like HicB family nuclease
MLACGQPVSAKEPTKKTTNAPNQAKPPNPSFPPPRSGFVQQTTAANADYVGLFSLQVSGWRQSSGAWLSSWSFGELAHSTVLWHMMGMRKSSKREFNVIVERDEAGFYVASVPALPGCHTQARSLDKLIERIREAIELCLEVERDAPEAVEFIGVQRVAV